MFYAVKRWLIDDVLRTCSPALEKRLRRRFLKTAWDNWPHRIRLAVACAENGHIIELGACRGFGRSIRAPGVLSEQLLPE
jgi:hypothetical protein